MFNILSGNIQVRMFIPIIVAALVPLFMFGINTWHKSVVEKQNKNISGTSFQVRYSKLTVGVLIFATVFFGIVALLFPILYLCDIPDGPPLEAVVGVACPSGVATIAWGVLLFGMQRWQISVSEDAIEVVPFFKKSKKYDWQDIAYVKTMYGNNQYGGAIGFRVYLKQSGKKAFSFTSFMAGGEKLVDELHKRGFVF